MKDPECEVHRYHMGDGRCTCSSDKDFCRDNLPTDVFRVIEESVESAASLSLPEPPRLLDYVHHDKICAHRKDSQAKCDCGLDEVLKSYRAGEDRLSAEQCAKEVLANCAMKFTDPERWAPNDPQSVIDQQIHNAAKIIEAYALARSTK